MSLACSFAGKRVLITGGAQGIGRELVQRFHDGGAVVFTLDKNSEAVNKLKDDLPSVTAVVVDLSNWEETKEAVEKLCPIDHLVNNAGIFIAEEFLDVKESSLMSLFAVHVSAVYNVSQIVAKGMIQRGQGGSIVNISSGCARFHVTMCSNYGPMKAAVENLTKSMAVELGPHNIRVNCVLPGLVNTHLSSNVPQNILKFHEVMIAKMLEKRRIEPSEIADLVIFLLSPLSAMITGQGVVIDGGYMAS